MVKAMINRVNHVDKLTINLEKGNLEQEFIVVTHCKCKGPVAVPSSDTADRISLID